MKKINAILTTLVVITLFVSCGDDDNLTVIAKSVEKTYTHEITLRGFPTESFVRDTIYLNEIIDPDAALTFTSAEFHPIFSFVEITNLKNAGVDTEIHNITVNVGDNRPFNLGNCIVAEEGETLPGSNYFPSDSPQQDKVYSELLKTIFSAYTSGNKKAPLVVTFEHTNTILPEQGVKLKLVLKGKYNYNTYLK